MATPSTPLRFEYREERFDFRVIGVPRTGLPRSARTRGGSLADGKVAIASIRFGWRSNNTLGQQRARQDAWDVIRPVLEERINKLGDEGWEATRMITPSILVEQTGDLDRWVSILLLLGLVTLLLAWLILPFVFFSSHYQWVFFTSATVPMRRVVTR